MGRFTGILGLVDHARARLRFLDQSARHSPEDGGVGLGLADLCSQSSCFALTPGESHFRKLETP